MSVSFHNLATKNKAHIGDYRSSASNEDSWKPSIEFVQFNAFFSKILGNKFFSKENEESKKSQKGRQNEKKEGKNEGKIFTSKLYKLTNNYYTYYYC